MTIMEMIGIITDEDVIKEKIEPDVKREREASRSVLYNEGDLALLWVAEQKYHKLPGGGVEEGENVMQALHREILEETGWSAEIEGELGAIQEIRGLYGLRQLSYCYLARALDKVDEPSFTEEERTKGFELRWMNIKNALRKIEKDTPNSYEGKFIHYRDLLFLKKAYTINGWII